MRILYVGASWLGSCARALREALGRQPHVDVAGVATDFLLPVDRTLAIRAAQRAFGSLHRREIKRRVLRTTADFRPDVVVFYKGSEFDADFLRSVQTRFAPVVNIFPDCSPHAHGVQLKEAVGDYDLVISTKPFHPSLWGNVYGYSNPCVFVPHGYDPTLHLCSEPASDFAYDVGLMATGRPEYHDLIRGLARRLGGFGLRVAIGGANWMPVRADLPMGWDLIGPQMGRAYVEWVRCAKIIIAPVQRTVVIDDRVQPGDEDSSRTYELAAAHCFYIHRRTDLIRTVYDEHAEVPLYDTAEDLARLIRHYLDRDERRAAMAAAAHRRAVPAYSFDSRAAEILGHIRHLIEAGVPQMTPDTEGATARH